jgi:riboflavin synthase
MFTGLIAELGTVRAFERDGTGATLSIASSLAPELAEGDSIAVNGACLTATQIDAEGFSAQAMNETLARTALGELVPAARVNLELPVQAGERLGGHFVQGHVDGIGVLRATHEEGISRVLEVRVPAALSRYLVEKGSVAVDGVSLTVSALLPDGFEVSLIPETLQRTSLGRADVGARLNIEVDILAKHIERLLEVRT